MAQIEIGALDLEAAVQFRGLLELIRHDISEIRGGVLERDAVLRTLGACH